MTDMHADPQLVDALRQALAHLYYPASLRKSDLIERFGLADHPNPASALRTALTTAIESLRPAPGAPANAAIQRYYQVLSQRYVQQFTQQDVANQLGISTRHLRREQKTAIGTLAEFLEQRYGSDSRHAAGEALVMAAATAAVNGADVEREMVWLGDSQGDQQAEVWPVLEDALHLARALAKQGHVVLALAEPEEDLPDVAVAPTVLKQIILNLLTTAIQSAPAGQVSVEATAGRQSVVVCVRAVDACPGRGAPLAWNAAGIEMSQRIAMLFEGEVTTSVGAGCLAISATLPSAEQVMVVAIEDNADTLQLWERYLQNSRFNLVPVRDPAHALSTAARLKPRLVLLDVMMPGIDGWDLLAQLHHHPETSAIPVVVCTVLPQRELALSLGASGFIRKPMTRQEFRSALERQLVDASLE